MLLVGNGRLITRDQNAPYFENGAVLVADGIVKEVGDFQDMKKKYADAQFIDAKGNVIMPGLINAHTHIYSAFARGMAGNGKVSKNFLDILNNLWWRMDKQLTQEDTKYSAYTTLMDSIKFGVTTLFDHHAAPFSATGSLFTIAEVAKELGIRVNLCYETSDRDGEEVLKAGIQENMEFIRYANKGDQETVRGMFGMHAPFTLSDKSLQMCAQVHDTNAGYHVHAAEGIEDLQHSLKHHGKRVIERLYDFDLLGEKTIAVHCIYINPREMDILADTKTNVVHNPESNMGNAVGCSPVIEMMKHGVTVGLGTDAYTEDMFESLKVANILHKHNLCDPNAAWVEVPKMLHENNRKIAKQYFGKEAGILKEGSFGDVIIVEYDPLTPMDEKNLDSHILFGMMGKSVTHTIAGGKVLMKDREILVADEGEITAKARETAGALWKRLNG